MVAIITGSGLGLERSSLALLGAGGQIGSARLGRGGQNVYVNAATGTLNLQRDDEFLVGRGPDQDLESEFSTGSQYWHTPNWRAVYGLDGAVNTVGTSVYRIGAFGDTVTFRYNAARGAYVNREGAGAHDELRFAGGVWSFTDGDSGRTEYYEQSWSGLMLVSRVVDRDGNTQSYTYDASGGWIARITNADGSFVEMTHTNNRPNEIKTSYVNASGGTSTMTRVRYTWDPAVNARLTALTVDLTPQDHSIADGNLYRINYGYDGSTQRLTSITQTDGSRLDIAYDATGRVVSVTETIATGVTRTTTLSYETDGFGNRFTRVRDAFLQETLLHYGPSGELTKIVTPPPVAGAAGAAVSYGYDADLNLTSVTDALGNVTTYTHDANGNVVTETDPFGTITYRRYNSANRLVAETRRGSDTGGADTAQTTRFAYDTEQHLRYTISAQGRVTEYRYSAAGDLEYTIDYPEHLHPSYNLGGEHDLTEGELNDWRNAIADRSSARITFNSFDARGMLASSTAYGIATGAGAASTAEGYSRTVFAYDQAGQLLSRMKEGQTAETFLYDGLGRLIGSTDLNGGVTRILFRDAATETVVQLANGSVQTSSYNKTGDLVGFTESSSINRLPNARLLEGTAGWNLGAAERFAAPPGAPAPYLFRQTSAAAQASSQTDVMTAPPGTHLNLSYAVKPGVAWQQFQTAIYWYDAAGAFLGANTFDHFPPDTGAFTTYERRVTKPAGAALYTIYTLATAGGLAEWGAHSLSVDNYLRDAGATSADGWSLGNSERVAGGASDPAAYLFRQLNTGQGMSQTSVAAAPEERKLYLSYALKPGAAFQQFQTAIYWYDSNGAFVTASTFDNFPADTTRFTTHEQEVVRPENGVLYSIYTLAVGGAVGQWGAHRLAPTPKNASASAGAPPASIEAHRYDKLGRLRMTTDASGFNTYHLYDKVGRRVADVSHNAGLTEYRYDAGNRLIATIRYTNAVAASHLASLADPNSSIELSAIRPAYHSWDVCSWTFYDQEGRVAATADGSGAVQTHAYDKSGRLVKSVAYFNRLAQWQTDSLKANTPLTVTPPAGDGRDVIVRNFYDRDGRLVGVLDGEGYLNRTHYDGAGQKVLELAYRNPTGAAHRAAGSLSDLEASTAAHADDRRTRYSYDGRGYLRFQIDGLDQVTELGYDSAGLVTSTVRYAGSIGATSDYSFDNVKALVAAAGLAGLPETRRSWSVYDARGRIAFSVDSEDAVTRFTYDLAGRVTKSVQYAAKRAGTTSLPTHDTMANWAAANDGHAANRVTRHYYNHRGERRFTVDAEGFVSRSDYDAAGRVVRERRWDAGLSGVHDGWTIDTVNAAAAGTFAETRYGYEAGGALTDVWNGENNWTRYGYHANGTLSYKAVVEADPSWTYYHHDGAGRVVAEYAANGTPEGATTLYAYDGHGNLASVTDPRGNVTTRTYDRLGQTVSQTDAAGTVSYEYNAFGEAVKATNGRGHASTSAYDRLGRLVLSTDAEGYATQTGYNAFGDVVSVTRGNATTGFLYDNLGRVKKTTDAMGFYEEYTLDAWGNRVAVRNKVGGVVTNSFDRRGLLIAETLPMASSDNNGNVVAASVTNRFEYDARGNRTKKIEAHGLGEQRTTTYVYDKADRLVETRGDAVVAMSQSDHIGTSSVVPTETIKYDQRGRITETIDALGARTLFWYDKLNRKTLELGATGTLTAFEYDKNGNLLSRRAYGTAVALPAPGAAPPAAPAGDFRLTSYEYDGANRLTKSVVTNIRTGALAGEAYAMTVGSIETTAQYDANGNVIRSTDGNGVSTFSYFDKLNRKVAQVDGENYLTFWFYDGEGNVTREERFAQRLGFPVTVDHNPHWLHSTLPASGKRITDFSYDKNGRRLSETRLGVNTSSLDVNGAIVAGAADSTIGYSYSGLGQILQKTFANGDYVTYGYDLSGRLTQENRAPFTDHTGTTVRPSTHYYYDGLNNLTLSRQGGQALGAGDRLTRYTYGAGGRMAAMTDAASNTYYYQYDAAGNAVRETWYRTKSDATTVIEGLLYTRDTLGRVTGRTLAAWTGSQWIKGDSQDTGYNAYGDVAQRGVNGLWQEQLAYDGIGRVWRSNSGDGVWRFFVHDKAGNRTLTLESEGANLAGFSLDQALAAATSNGVHAVGAAYVDGINATIGVFDKRSQQTETRLPFRQLNASALQSLKTSRTYTAFGEVASETDARNKTTDFLYNTMGRLIEKRSPEASHTAENGAVATARPVETYFYDVAGRAIGVRDANSKSVTRALLGGTGHDGSEASVTAEFHLDGGIFRTFYDVFGDARIVRDELGRDEARAYDAMGRLVQQTHKGGLLTDYYSYDLLGQRTRHWNSHLGSGNVETSDYDVQGRVVRQVAFGGDTTTSSYAWSGSIGTAVGTHGGWVVTTTHANSRSSTEHNDLFGRTVYKLDLGGHAFSYAYDAAGRMTQQSTAGETLTYGWLNTGLAGSVSNGAGNEASYGYDAGGNRTSEYTLRNYAVVQNAAATYDALGRLSTWSEAGNSTAPTASMSYEYDLTGNIRRANSQFRVLDDFGNAGGWVAGTDKWYRYDSLNRVVQEDASLVGGVISGGIHYSYNAAGERVTATRSASLSRKLWRHTPTYGQSTWWEYREDLYGGSWSYTAYNYTGNQRETYGYRADGSLQSVSINQDGVQALGTATPQKVAMDGTAGTVRASFVRDAMGRASEQIDYLEDGVTAAYHRIATLNAKGQATNETTHTRQGTDTWTSTITYDYGSGAAYALGSAVTVGTSDSKNGTWQYNTTTTNSFAWYDGAVQSQMTYAKTNQPTYNSYYYYGASGQLSSIQINDGRPRTVTLTNDMNGQAIRRDEADGLSGGDPHEVWYRFNGRQLGFTGNNGTLETDYSTSIQNRTKPSPATIGPFRSGASSGSSYQDFDPALDAINSYSQGSSGGSYTVRDGDTLAGIAAQLWGDASLWYKLAEANGLSGAAALRGGQSLHVPVGVNSSSHNASTFRPYDPSEAVGDASPTNPKAPKKNKCGMFGQILLVAIAVAVTVVTSGALAAASISAVSGAGFSLGAGVAALTGTAAGGFGLTTIGMVAVGAAGAAAGSIASQGIGVATGVQGKFSWKGVALAALAGGIGAGLGPGGAFGRAGAFGAVGSKLVAGALRAGVGSIATQGLGVAIGLQKKFDFAGVAAAAVGGGVATWAGNKLAPMPGMTRHTAQLLSGTASAMANAATRSLIEGSSFGDNIIAALPDVVGATLGNLIADGVHSLASPRAAGGSNRPGGGDDWAREVGEIDAAIKALTAEKTAKPFEVTLPGQLPEPGERDWNPARDLGERIFGRMENRRQELLRQLVALRDDLIDRIKNMPAAAANGLADSMRGPNARDITSGERGILTRAFGSRLDLRNVRIVRGYGSNPAVQYAFEYENRPAMTFGNTVYMNEAARAYYPDLSTGPNPGQRRVNIERLAHEFTHVLQFQRHGFNNVIARASVERARYGARGAYDYEGPHLGNRMVWNLPLEAQAEMIGHYVMMRETGRFDAREGRIYMRTTERLRGSGIYGL